MQQKLYELMYALLPETALLALSIRLVVLGASIGDAIALIGLVTLIGYKRFLSKKKVEQADELQRSINSLNEQRELDKLALKDEINGLRNAINALKMDKAFQLNKRVNLEQENTTGQQQAPVKRLF